jgi:hypothetical protein
MRSGMAKSGLVFTPGGAYIEVLLEAKSGARGILENDGAGCEIF